MVAAARHLDTDAGQKMVSEVREIFADLNHIRLNERRHLLEFKFELDLRAVDRLGEEMACDYLAQMAVNKLRGYLERRKKNLVPKKN